MKEKSIKEHWQSIYTEKSPQEVSWYQQVPAISLDLIRRFSNKHSRIIDIGGGASVLIDHLLKAGYENLSVLDISCKALEHIKSRLSDQAHLIEWFDSDITEFSPPHSYDMWHDRAVFHFLTDKIARQLYVNVLKETVQSGAYVIIATFSKDGPHKCSGLEVVQYDNPSIMYELGEQFILLENQFEMHVTPSGKEQQFIYFVFQRK